MTISEQDIMRLFGRMASVYNLMKKRENDDGLYVGPLVALYKEATDDAPVAHYSKSFRFLEEMGCITREYIGRGGKPSRVRLHRPPTTEALVKVYRPHLTARVTYDRLLQRVEQVEGRFPQGVDLTSYIENLESRMADLSARLERVEAKREESIAS